MGFFNESVPTLCCKQPVLDIQDLQGLWRVQWGYRDIVFRSTFYTRLDQACLLWGILCAVIFLTLQFCSINYFVQAALWSLLTLMATIATIYWTKFWVQVEQATWVLYCWAVLMILGLAVTDLVLWLQWGRGMLYLCSLWLGFNAVGYFCNGFALRSRQNTLPRIELSPDLRSLLLAWVRRSFKLS